MNDPSLSQLHAARETFSALVARVRPELSRYCARMMGSTIDGEDVVQETLARAFYELARLRELPAMRAWLFRIAHNRAINALIARGRRETDRLLDEDDVGPQDETAVDAALEQAEAVDVAIGTFLALPPAQRACVILRDVLDLSLQETADTLELSIPAVKAALHRGRSRLRELAGAPPRRVHRAHSTELLRYVELFNARDWDGVRATLAQDVKLDVVARDQRRGIADVGRYFSNYGRLTDWHLAPAWMDGREVIAVRRAPADDRPSYVIELSIVTGEVVAIRDFRHAPHVVDEATFEPHA